ncbi:MAG: DUF2304 family protein [Candidatus Woesearchaeota archaeon]
MTNLLLLQVLVSAFVIFAISRSFIRFRSQQSSLLEFMLWLVVWGAVLTVVWNPTVTQYPAKIFGFSNGLIMLVYFSILILFYSIYRIYSKIERIEHEITTITRSIALQKIKSRK